MGAYIRWIQQAAKLLPEGNAELLICSDAEIDLAELHNIRCEFRGKSDLKNGAALSKCDRIIAPPSSFAGWAPPSQSMTNPGFITIRNHPDLRDDAYPPDLDLTDSLFPPRA